LDREALLEPRSLHSRPATLDAPITTLAVPVKLAAAAAEIGITSLGDLLRHIRTPTATAPIRSASET
jgi:hypothetical protein